MNGAEMSRNQVTGSLVVSFAAYGLAVFGLVHGLHDMGISRWWAAVFFAVDLGTGRVRDNLAGLRPPMWFYVLSATILAVSAYLSVALGSDRAPLITTGGLVLFAWQMGMMVFLLWDRRVRIPSVLGNPFSCSRSRARALAAEQNYKEADEKMIRMGYTRR